MTAITGKTILITGANRGIGRALLDEALRRDAKQVYAGTRGSFAHPDERVTPLILDVTDAEQIQQAAQAVPALDILVNNAGVAVPDDLSDSAALEQHLAVNLFGIHGVTQAFLPLLTRSRGVIVNNLSDAAIAPLSIVPAYSISKAAALSLTQSQRMLYADQGISVHAVFTGPTDTDMNAEFDFPKTPPESVARAIFDGVENREEDIFPDPGSQTKAAGWRSSPGAAQGREDAATTTPTPGSILLGTTRPAELRDWYRKALAPGHEGDGPIDLGGFLLVIEQRDDVEAKNNEPGRMILNFHVDDFDAVAAQLRAADVDWLVPVSDRPGGIFGTFVDPDGNYLQIIQLK
jgi:NAD(P)-dependent dehydrogenase (short-subunit alcohol dehydrogenase family)